MFNKVLAATARPLECDESVLSADQISQHDNGKLLILHVLESESSIYRNYVKHYRSGDEILGDTAYQEEVKKVNQMDPNGMWAVLSSASASGLFARWWSSRIPKY